MVASEQNRPDVARRRDQWLDRNEPVWLGLEGAVESKVCDLAGEFSGLCLRRSGLEVVSAQIAIEGAVFEHVVDGGQDRSCDGANGLLGAAAVTDPAELGLQVAALCSRTGPGALDQGGLQPWCPLAQPIGPALAGAFVVAWAQSRPGDEVSRGRESAHVDADFAADHLRAQIAHAMDAAQLTHRITKRGEITVHLLVDLGDSVRQGIDLAQMQPQQEAVAVIDAALQGGTQSLRRRLDAPVDQREQMIDVVVSSVVV